MENIFKSIAPDSTGYFDVSHWFFWTALVTFIVLAIVVAIVYRFKGKVWALVTGLISGAVLLGLFITILNTSHVEHEVLMQTKKWLSLPGFVFIRLVMIIIPVYLFFIVSNFVLSEHFGDIKKRTYGISFASLLGLSLFGILIAMLLAPLIALIPNDLWPTDDSIVIREEEEGISWLWILFLVVILVSFFGSLIFRLVAPSKIEKANKWVEVVVKYLTIYFSIVIISVPFVIMGQLSIIGLNDEPWDNIKLMGIYMGIFWLGALTIFIVLFAGNILIANKEIKVKTRAAILLDQVTTVFAYQSTTASLPETQANVRKLGVCEEISKLTPTKGVFMGMVMCNGFAPMLMLEFTLASAGMLTIANVLLISLIVFSLTISTSGSGSADYFIITTTIGIFNGIDTNLYLQVLLPVQEINERTITRPNNTLGHVFATQLVDKYHYKLSNKECDCCTEIEKEEDN